jgi:beta-mannosidase
MMNRLSIVGLTLVIHFFSVCQQTLDWKFQHPVSKKWVAFGTHGSVQEALIKTGELPDPFVGTNELKFGWIENHDWEFQSEFTLSVADLAHDFIDLEFPNVDTYAKIYLNGHLLGTTENCYLIYRFEIRKWAKTGVNKLKMVFQSPVNYQAPKIKNTGITLPAPNDLGKIAVAPYCRKPQYQFGWDWSLRMTTIGLWKPASVIVYNSNRTIGKSVYTATLAEDFALMELQWMMRNTTNDTMVWESQLFGSSEVVAENGLLKRLDRMENPRLWWPRGQGEQHLYTDRWTLKTKTGTVIDSLTQRFGVRRTELVNVADQWGTSYTIRVNGRDVFCKGADYIPQDIFPARVTDASLRESVLTMYNCNFNMVRIWGGGYYQPEAFYDACDELGIMVWQDFMFACAMYPGTDGFVATVKQELDQQIPRLAAHASLVLFNGNNEVDVAWKNWGFQDTYKITPQQGTKIEQYYDRIFKRLIPESIKQWTNVPYVHTSPLSNWGKDEYFNHGSMHYWGVWHGKDPIEDFGRKTGRFNAEYGFQSFPEYATLLTFSDTSQWQLLSPVMKHHQKSYVGNGMIEKHASILYGKTTDFKRFVYYSQLTQSTAVSMAVSGHRTDMPRCSGTVYWQLNDCWPAPSWSSIDYFGNWKALQYTVKDDYADVAVLAKVDTLGKEKYFLVSDQPHAFGCKISAVVYDLEGNQLSQFQCNQAVMGVKVNRLFELELAAYKTQNYLIRFTWNDASGKPNERSFTHLPEKRSTATADNVSYRLLEIDPVSKTAVIEVENTAFIGKCWVTSRKNGVRFTSNFIDLLPGIHRFSITFETLPVESDFELIWL